jgi:hypothetical protein
MRPDETRIIEATRRAREMPAYRDAIAAMAAIREEQARRNLEALVTAEEEDPDLKYLSDEWEELNR